MTQAELKELSELAKLELSEIEEKVFAVIRKETAEEEAAKPTTRPSEPIEDDFLEEEPVKPTRAASRSKSTKANIDIAVDD